jgi:hypothetical protein
MRLFNLTRRGAFVAASSTKPLQTGTPLPKARSIGAVFPNTSAPTGQNPYACTPATVCLVRESAPPSAARRANMVPSHNIYLQAPVMNTGAGNLGRGRWQ